MRTIITIALLISLMFLIGCSKSDDPEIEDNIDFQVINKNITYLKPDSIPGNCKDLIFEIEEYDLNLFTAYIKLNSLVLPCDGFNNINANRITGKVQLMDENQEISSIGNWQSANRISLDDFAGKGEKYIGYRSGYYPLSENRYHYGWIKIELSEDYQTLRIISRATNYTDNKPIFTGQH